MKKFFFFLPILTKDNAAHFLIWHLVSSGVILLDIKHQGANYFVPSIWAMLAMGPWIYTGKQLFLSDS